MQAIRSAVNRQRIIAVVGTAGGVGVIAGAVLPWLTVFHGLRSYSGIVGVNGRVLAAGGAVAALLAIWYGVRPQTGLRYALGLVGFALALFSAYLVAQLLDVYHALEGMYLPTLGPGLVVAAAGALLLIATLFVRIASPERTEGVARLDARAAALIALSAGAGTIHLAVAAEHFIEFRLYGVFFVALGIAQIGWAAVVAIRGVSRPLLLAATGNALVVWLWSLSRTTGLPIGPTPGVPESVGFADVAATAFEAVLVGWVAWSLARPRRSSNRLERVGWALPLIVATVTIAAVLLSGGGHGGHA